MYLLAEPKKSLKKTSHVLTPKPHSEEEEATPNFGRQITLVHGPRRPTRGLQVVSLEDAHPTPSTSVPEWCAS